MKEHGEIGHCNIYTKDHDSRITGYGKHDRVVVFLPQFDEEVNEIAVYVRIDHIWNLGKPTDNQVLAVIKNDQHIAGKWKKSLERAFPQSNATEQWYIRQ